MKKSNNKGNPKKQLKRKTNNKTKNDNNILSPNVIYDGHISQLLHYSTHLNRYRVSVFTINSILLAIAANVFFVRGLNTQNFSLTQRFLALIVLLVATTVSNAVIHFLTHIYLRVIRNIEDDLVGLVKEYPQIQIWRNRIDSREKMKKEQKIRYQLTYFGTVLLFYAGVLLLLIAAIINTWFIKL